MSSEKYIGLDVHQATISVAVMDPTGKLIMESRLPPGSSRGGVFNLTRTTEGEIIHRVDSISASPQNR